MKKAAIGDGAVSGTQPVPFLESRGELGRVSRYVGAAVPTVLVGPTGCGKTTLVTLAAYDEGLETITAVGDAGLSVSDLLGRWHLTPAGSEWRDGPLTRAVREGSLFYLDEVGAVPEGVLKTLYPLLDHRRTLEIAARPERVVAAEGFRFVGSFNPSYGDGGRSLTPAFRQRCAFVSVSYLSKDQEAEMVIERTGVSPETASFLVDAAAVTRGRIRGMLPEGASTRLLLMAAQMLRAGLGELEVIEGCIVGPLTDDPHVRAAVFGALEAAGLVSRSEIESLRLPPPPESPFVPADEDFFDARN